MLVLAVFRPLVQPSTHYPWFPSPTDVSLLGIFRPRLGEIIFLILDPRHDASTELDQGRETMFDEVIRCWPITLSRVPARPRLGRGLARDKRYRIPRRESISLATSRAEGSLVCGHLLSLASASACYPKPQAEDKLPLRRTARSRTRTNPESTGYTRLHSIRAV